MIELFAVVDVVVLSGSLLVGNGNYGRRITDKEFIRVICYQQEKASLQPEDISSPILAGTSFQK